MWCGCHIRNCDTDESRSLATALQEEVANRCMPLSPERVKVVNDTLKGSYELSGDHIGDDRKRTIDDASKCNG